MFDAWSWIYFRRCAPLEPLEDMNALIYRIGKVIQVYDGLELIPERWGDGEAALGDVVEFHRPDGIIVIAPINCLKQGVTVVLKDLVSFDLITVGTEIRVRDSLARSESRFRLKRKAH